ncbi:glycosyltransferase family 9 protein [Propionivibrio sp.]|uniref:glycosyltransferase family 9 protein n=1 Tax=Propionivibrio sp. TaxID=2212460 RepID=UPI002638E0F2|nr:glycosyltransferase family 9 protein [Propionivibrio sp.]
MNSTPRILLIRRDNIGDLLCTTPLLHAIRQRYPQAYLAVLASSYNVAVLNGNPDIDDVFVYLKRQQRSHEHGLLSMLWKRWALIRMLRTRRFDHVLLANGGWRYARQLGGKSIIGFRERDNPDHRQPDIVVPLANRGRDDHEVAKMALLGSAIGVEQAVGPLHIFPDAALVTTAGVRLRELGWHPEQSTLAVHISSRQPGQRWPEAFFVEFIRRLNEHDKRQILLFWAPGLEDDPMHPGDDGKAARILAQLANLPVFPCPTRSIEVLTATLSLAGQMVCSDGGAMHIAAALGKPIVCFFGHSNCVEWHPWHVPYVLLQADSKRVQDISVEDALAAVREASAMSSAPIRKKKICSM